MLYISHPPIQVEIQDDRKIIVLLNNKIIFSHLDFIQEYLSIPLITQRPFKMCYEPTVMQTMVVSQTAVQVYYCDWKTQIKLIKVIILNNEIVQNFFYQKQTGWHIYGSMFDYQPIKISFHRFQHQKNQKILSKCYINKSKYILTQSKLQKYHTQQQPKQILWKDRMMVLRNCNFNIQMYGSSTLDHKKDLICMNQTYIIIISGFQVLLTTILPTVSYLNNNLLISYVNHDKFISVQKYQNNQFVQIGTINKLNGQLCGAFLFQNDLMMLQYQQKQIHINSLPLTVSNNQGNPQKRNQQKKKLFQSITRIMEESLQDGRQFPQRDDRNIDSQKSQNAAPKADYQPSNKPLIRKVTINDDEIRDDTLNEQDSQVLSRSGIQQVPQRLIAQNNFDKVQQQISFEAHDQNKKKLTRLRKKSLPQQKYQNQNNIQNNHNIIQSNNSINKQRKSKSFKNYNKKQHQIQQNFFNSATHKNNQQNIINNVSLQSNQSNKNNSCSYSYDSQIPMFGFSGGYDIVQKDKQTKQNKKTIYIDPRQQNSNVLEQSFCIRDAQKSIIKLIPDVLPIKVQKFKPLHTPLTTQIFNKIQKSTYCSLISKSIQQDPNRLQQLMQLFLIQVLNQAQAPLFFQKKIRLINPQLTQEKLRKLFSPIINKKQYKKKITQALQMFKLNQVPHQLLYFPQDFIKIMTLLYKQVYIQDLLKPSQSVIQYLLQSYFSIKNFTSQVIMIQDQQIDITHPRNMLNVLLYLNQVFALKIQTIVKVYCSKLVSQNYLDILKKITIKQNIFQICQVSRSVLDDVIIQRFTQLLNQSTDNAEYLWTIIDFLRDQVIDQYRSKLAIICQLNRCNLIFDLPSFLKIKQINFNIYQFLQKIINQNSCKNLQHAKLQGIYRSLYWLQDHQKIVFYTNQYIQLIKNLAQKFCQKKSFYHAFKHLQPILPKIKPSFIAKLLYQHLNSKFINRLSDCPSSNKIQNLKILFPQLCSSSQLDLTQYQNDKIKIPNFSNSFSCTWKKFINILQKYIDAPLQLKIFIFSSINTAYQLFAMLDQNTKRKFLNFITQIKQCIITQIDDINQNDQSINPKGFTTIRIQPNHKNQLQSQLATSALNNQDVILQDQQGSSQKKKVYKSMTLINHYSDQCNLKIRRNSAQKNLDRKNNHHHDQDLMRVKSLVGKNQIIDQLSDIYENRSPEIFIESLQLVDLQKIQIYHIDLFKTIINKQIDFSLSKLLPFEVFLTPLPNQAFEIARSKIKSQLSITNFWLIYTIIQLMFQMGNELCKIFIQKCIINYKIQNFQLLIQQLIKIIKPKLDRNFIDKIIQLAKNYNLNQIQHIFNQQLF